MAYIKFFSIFLILFASVISRALANDLPHFDKVLIVILENTKMEKALQQPFLSAFTKQGALLNNYYGVGRPSQPNYIALIAGDTLSVSTDSNVNLKENHLGDLLESNHRSWKTYAEGYPGNCDLRQRIGKYVRKHSPFISFINVQNDLQRCRQIVSADEFEKDVAENKLANFNFYIPNLDNDGHDTGVKFADNWLNKKFGKLVNDENFMKSVLFVITFDEGNLFSNHIYTVLAGAGVKKGIVLQNRLNHYNLLKTIETEWDLGDLHRRDAEAEPITKIWAN